MNSLLNPDNPVMQFITKIVNAVYLNILWFFCSLPVFTIGASTTALYYVTLKMVKNEEGNITKAFFHSFRENFKQGTVIWLILLGFGILFGIDGTEELCSPTPSIHRLRRGLPGYLILFAAFEPQRQLPSSKPPSPLVLSLIHI